MFVAWDLRKDRRTEKAERLRVLRLLATEAVENSRRADEIRTSLLREIELSKASQILAMSVGGFSSDGWMIVKSRNIVEYLQESLTKWIRVYTTVDYLNRTLQARDITRATAGVFNSPVSRMKQLDGVILESLTEFKNELQKAVDTLPDNVKPSEVELH